MIAVRVSELLDVAWRRLGRPVGVFATTRSVALAGDRDFTLDCGIDVPLGLRPKTHQRNNAPLQNFSNSLPSVERDAAVFCGGTQTSTLPFGQGKGARRVRSETGAKRRGSRPKSKNLEGGHGQ
jgi:hypothetical protein